MKRSALFGVLLTLFLLTWSCKDDPSGDNVNIAIQDEFKILLWENLHSNFRSFQLKIETIESNFCENTLIETNTSTENGFIAVVINEISENSCSSSIYPATSEFEIGALVNNEYDLFVSLKEVIYNYGKLIVEDQYFELEMNSLDGIVVPNERLYKVPLNTIWGYVASDGGNLNLVYDEFLNELNNITSDRIFNDGHYGYFSSEDNELTILSEEISQNNHKSFGFGYDGNSNEVINMLDAFRTHYPNASFKIFTSKGEVL